MDDIFKDFGPRTTIIISVVFPGEYRIGFKTDTHTYIPGFGGYWDFEVALQKAIDVYKIIYSDELD